MAAARRTDESFQTELVPGPLEYAVLRPDGDDLPLVLLLHGGGGDRTFLAQMQPLIERAWERGLLPPAVFATPNAGRSFYMDYRDGSESWETLLRGPFLAHLRKTLPVRGDRASTAVMGISMGGMGTLRMGFKHPELATCLAALEPGIEPSLSFAGIESRDRIYRSQEVYERIFGSPVDEAYWQANNPANLASAHAETLRTAGSSLYLECGDLDSFGLHRGAEFLHRILYDAGVPHEYRLVRGADHVGLSLGPRFTDALGFVGRALDPPPEDTTLAPFHQMVAEMKRTQS